MTIHILHDKNAYVGRVIYNFNQVSNMVLVLFDKPIYGNSKHIFLQFDEVSKSWMDGEGIYKQNPFLFGQILNKVGKPLKENYRMLDCRS